MKKYMFFLMFFFIFLGKSQEKKNDITINPIFLVLGAFHASYDRIIDENQTFGVTIMYTFDNKIGDNLGKGNYAIKPQYRYYFGKKTAAGFFIEGYARYGKDNFDKEITTYNSQYGYTSTTFENAQETAFGLGFGFGGKWITKKNILFEASMGINRNFTATKENKVSQLGMLGIGYRF